MSISSSATDFLEDKIAHLSSAINNLNANKAGLLEMHQGNAAEHQRLDLKSSISKPSSNRTLTNG